MMWEREKEWARVVLGSFAGSDAGFVVKDDEVDYVDGALTYMRTASEKARFGLRVAFVMAYTAPLWLWGRFTTLGGLPREERSRVLGDLGTHGIFMVRELTLLLKLIACMGIFRSPAARARTSFDPPARRSLPLVASAAERAA